ncbi:hypothetical protein EY01_14770, partial [Staphylococcus aureus]
LLCMRESAGELKRSDLWLLGPFMHAEKRRRAVAQGPQAVRGFSACAKAQATRSAVTPGC